MLQLADVVTNGYWHARSLEFFEKHAYIEWLRLPGDVIFIAGVVPLLYLTGLSVIRPADLRAASGRPADNAASPLYSIEAAADAGA